MKKIIYTSIVFLFALNVFSQKQIIEKTGEYIKLDNYHPGNNTYKYTASKSVRLIEDDKSRTRFSYSPEPDQFFHAITDPLMVFPPEEGETGGPPNYNGEGVVGTTNGIFQVSNTGQANYTIPLEFPGGVAGMTPNLKLVYNSTGKDGIFGPGWSLSGLSVISQVPANRYYDGIKNAAYGGDYIAKAYTLDGQRLIMTDFEDENYIEFRKEQDDFSHIVREPYEKNTETVDSYQFVVKTMSGLTYYYGETENSRQTVTVGNPPTQTEICLSYYVSRIVDNFGNTIEFEYEKPTTSEIYINKIEYTTTIRDDPTYRIFFVYQDRNYPYVTYYNYQPENTPEATIAVTSDRIVDMIYCEYAEEQVFVKKYDLDYSLRGPGTEDDHRQHYLASVQEYGVDFEGEERAKYNKTMFEWDEENYGMDLLYYSLPVLIFNDTEPKKFFVDINNDSKKELIVAGIFQPTIFNYAVKVYILKAVNTGNGIEYEIFETLTFEPEDTVYNEDKIWYNIHFGDYDGNGSNEMVFSLNWIEHYHDDWYRTEVSRLNFDQEIAISILLNEQYIYNTYSADFNGDGISDLLFQKLPESNLTWKLGDPDEPLTSNQDKNENGEVILTYDPPAIESDEPFEILDFNGDGRADIIANGTLYFLVPGDGGIEWSLETLESYNATFCNLNHDRKIDGIQISGYSAYNSPDCNGSYIPVDLQVDFFHGIGRGLIPKGESQIFEMSFPMPQLPQQISDCVAIGWADILNIADFNGDGLSDFMVKVGASVSYRDENTWTIGQEDTYDYYYLITSPSGDNVTMHEAGGGDNYISSEITGDFQSEIVGYIDDQIVVISPYYSGSSISKITNGLGAETIIEYAFSGDEEVYGFDPDAEYEFPLIPYNTTKKLVKSVERSNGRGGYYSTSYYYEDAVVHTEGLGFIGFRKVTITDNDQELKFKTYYGINENYYFSFPETSEKRTLSGQLLQQTVNVYNYKFFPGEYFEELGQTYYFPYKQSSTNKFYKLIDGTKYKCEITEYLNYDDYGFPVTVKHRKGPHVNYLPFVTTITHIYEHYDTEDQWILGRLISAISVSEGPGNDDITRTTEYTYYDETDGNLFGMLKDEITEPDKPDEKLTKTYTYDDYGNIETTTYSVGDQDLEERVNTTYYDENGRFIEELYNALDHKTIREYDPILGILESETDADNNLTTTYRYDGFGRLTKTIDPTGNQSVGVLRWVQPDDDNAPPNAVYYSWSQTSGISPVWNYYDCNGVELRKVKKGFNMNYIFVDTEYNVKGQITSKTEPYYKDCQVFETTYDAYDVLGRIKTITLADGTQSHFDYDGLTTTLTNALGQATEKKLNAAGWLVRSTDENGETVVHQYFSNGKVKKTWVEDHDASKREYDYDIVGRLKYYKDASQGIIEYEYNAFGELTEVKRNGEVTEEYPEYDKLGRLREKLVYETDGTYATTWVYDQGKTGMLDQVRLTDLYGLEVHKIEYDYDEYLRTEMVSEYIEGESFVKNYTYDVLGRLKTYTYPTGFRIENRYNAMGYLGKIVSKNENKVLWRATAMNAREQYETVQLGNNIYQEWNYYEETGRIHSITTPGLQVNEYGWDEIGNLEYRNTLSSNITESFEYDDLNRLRYVYHNDELQNEIAYDELGNIEFKSDVGNYGYDDPLNSYKLSMIADQPSIINENQNIIFNVFNKVLFIEEHNPDTYQLVRDLELIYGAGKQRIKQVFKTYGEEPSETSKYYTGSNFEKIIEDGVTKYVHYISSPQGLIAILTRSAAGNDALNYVLTDHLGSVQILTNEQGTLLGEYSYDAWGLRRDPGTLQVYVADPETAAEYGFTGHEHLDAFALVNMNGRMYDPVLGRFLSPDPVLQFPDYSQGLNPYSYALNNPLRYIDPSGYTLVGNLIAIGVSIVLVPMPMLAVLAYSVVMTIDYAIENGRNANIGDIGKYFAQTFVMNMASMGTSKVIGEIFKHTAGSIWNELGRAAAHGLTNGAMRMIQGGKFEHGFLSGFVSSLGGSFMQEYGGDMGLETKIAINAAVGGTIEAIGGGKFANGAVTGAYVMMFNHLQDKNQERKAEKEFRNTIPKETLAAMTPEQRKTFYHLYRELRRQGYEYINHETFIRDINLNSSVYLSIAIFQGALGLKLPSVVKIPAYLAALATTYQSQSYSNILLNYAKPNGKTNIGVFVKGEFTEISYDVSYIDAFTGINLGSISIPYQKFRLK